MVTGEYLSLREAADMLGIETWRVARLGRYLGMASSEKRIPREEVQRITVEDTADDRYDAIRQWLLAAFLQQKDMNNGRSR